MRMSSVEVSEDDVTIERMPVVVGSVRDDLIRDGVAIVAGELLPAPGAGLREGHAVRLPRGHALRRG